MALTLFGVTFHDAHHSTAPTPGVESVVVRDLAAIVASAPYALQDPTEDRVERASSVIAACALRGAVLPAPVGVVFRSRDAVLRWLELHYVALRDALNFVDARVVARVHVRRPGDTEDREAGTDLAAAAAEGLRVLRRSAVASVPLRLEQVTGVVSSAAFLVEQELWKDFGAKVSEQGARVPSLRFDLTGPWPPFDFVQMQFGA